MRRGLTTQVLALSGVATAVVAAVFAVLLLAVGQLRHSADMARHSESVIAAAARVEGLVIDAETGQRGFVITGQERFLEPLQNAERVLPRETRELERLVGDNPAQQRAAQGISAAVRAYLGGYVRPLVARVRRDRAAAIATVASGAGKRRVDAIRVRFDRFVAVERTLQRQRRAAAEASARRAVAAGIGGLAGCVLLVLALTLFTQRRIIRPVRRLAGASARLASGDLAARVTAGGAGEIGDLERDFNAMAGSLEAARDEQESQNTELELQQWELERALGELAEEKERVETFHELGQRFAAETESGALGHALLGGMGDFLTAEVGTLYAATEHEADTAELVLVAARGVDATRLPATLPEGVGLAGRAARERGAVVASHGGSTLRVPVFGQDAAVAHELHLPLLIGERVIGVITLGRLADRGFAPSERLGVEHLGRQAAVALSNVLSLERARRQATIHRAVLETANDAFVSVDELGAITAWNPQAEALFGWSSTEAIGRQALEVMFPSSQRRCAEQTFERFATGDGASARPPELYAMRRDGETFPIELTVSPLCLDGRWTYNAFVRDISDRRRADRHFRTLFSVTRVLAESATLAEAMPKLLRELGESMGSQAAGAWEVSRESAHVRLDALWCASCAPDTSAIEAARGSRAADRDLAERVLERGEPAWVDDDALRAPCSHGHAQTVATRLGLPVTGDGGVVGVIELYGGEIERRDDALLELCRALGGQIGQFVERKRAKAEAERLKDEFFALVSHELRTPLTSILGYLELLHDDGLEELGPERAHFLEVVDRNARRLLRLVGDLLFVAQFEAGSLTLEPGPMDLETVARDSVEAARPIAEQRGVALALTADSVAPLDGDRDRLAQAVDNLVSNALKYTPPGGRVEVGLTVEGGCAVLAVTDTGVGIPEGEQGRLFERFFRASSATERAIPGVGLGLTIVKAIVEGHGGRVAFSSQLGSGTSFRVELPLVSAGASTEQRTLAQAG